MINKKRFMKKVIASSLAFTMVLSSTGFTKMSKVEAAAIPVENETLTNDDGIPLPNNYYDRKVVGYFPNYAFDLEAHKNFNITQLQWDKLTHVQYAFAIADPVTYELIPSEMENDVLNKFEGMDFYHKGQKIEMNPDLGYYGQFNLMHTMKSMYPDVTVLVSTGGWAASQSLWLVTDNETNMRKFADSVVDFIRKYGFDGIDIDFEFPSETSQSGNPDDFHISEPRRDGIGERYTKFLEIMRAALTKASEEDGRYYWLTSAVTASSWVLGGQNTSAFLDYLDFVSIMSYDYHGGWNEFVENQANIYPDPNDTETSSLALPTLGFEWSKNYYRGAVQSEKILMGIPYYTRGWTNVQGGTNGLHGRSNTPAVGDENIWHDLDANGNEMPAGANPLWHVLNLMEKDSNYQKFWDPVGRVPYVWNNEKKTFLTFEDERSIQERINKVEEDNLGGVLIWVMHGDYDYDEENSEYTVGDTLTTMLHSQLTGMPKAEITTDYELGVPTLDFDAEFTGKYDHPNYYYTINVTNNTGEALQGWTLSFDLPKSAEFGSTYGGGPAVITDAKDPAFKTVTLSSPGWQVLEDGETTKLEGAIKLNFGGVKNYKLNGHPMKSEIAAEIARLRNMGFDIPDAPEVEKPEGPGNPDPDPENPDPDPSEDTYDINGTYVKGDIVVYQGVKYVAKWWTKGDIPDPNNAFGPWEVVK